MAANTVASPPLGTLIPVPVLRHRFLPGCRDCGLPHPRAARPPIDSDACTGCGKPLPTGEEIEERAVLTGAASIIARMLMRAGQWLRTLSTRF